MKRTLVFSIIVGSLMLCSGLALATKVVKTATVDAENEFTAPVSLQGVFNVSIVSSSFSGTMTLQRSFDKGQNWLDVETWASTSTEEWKFEPEGNVQYRLGCKTGAFTSGSAVIRLSQ